jgi:hypothetical protein
MHLRQNLASGKRKYGFALVLLLIISVFCVAFSIGDREGFDSSRREVLLRSIGHEVLLQSGDSTSRVLPVKKIAENEYQISFEKAITFQPDSLVNSSRRLLAKDPLTHDYVVNVLNCRDASVAYGYAVSENKKDDIVACLGREQPRACYKINIKFQPGGISTIKKGFLYGSFLFLAIGGILFWRSVRPQKVLPGCGSTESGHAPAVLQHQPAGIFTLGLMSFDAETRKLVVNEKAFDLTKTETRILRIFALSPNETIERSRLQKEIWEDEGVIVGRSLDMFISKLRKKLESDPNIKIVVIRGKGYKLEI